MKFNKDWGNGTRLANSEVQHLAFWNVSDGTDTNAPPVTPAPRKPFHCFDLNTYYHFYLFHCGTRHLALKNYT